MTIICKNPYPNDYLPQENYHITECGENVDFSQVSFNDRNKTVINLQFAVMDCDRTSATKRLYDKCLWWGKIAWEWH